MSLIVACKRDGVVYMGADTQRTCGSYIERILNEKGFKIIRLSNGMLIGMSGSVKMHQKVMANKRWFDIWENETFDKRYIVKNIIPELYALMKTYSDKDTRCSSMELSMLIAWREKVFIVTNKFKVYECNSYAAIGAGTEYSKYELMQINGGDVNEGLLKALRAGARFDSTVSAPYILIDTNDREYKIVEG